MKAKASTALNMKKLSQKHQRLVDQLSSDTKRVKPVPTALTQWLLWLAVSSAIMGVFIWTYHLQAGAGEVFSRMPPVLFILTALTGSALAAWEAIASSVPGSQTARGYRVTALLVLLVLISLPFLFFYPWGQTFDLFGAFMNGMECVQQVSLVGLLPWVLLAGLISRNASFHPAWTGAWSGASAFLLGTVTVQLHCPNWDARHILAAHLLPVVLLTFLATFVGAFLYSRWEK
jgi:hypothetical protein